MISKYVVIMLSSDVPSGWTTGEHVIASIRGASYGTRCRVVVWATLPLQLETALSMDSNVLWWACYHETHRSFKAALHSAAFLTVGEYFTYELGDDELDAVRQVLSKRELDLTVDARGVKVRTLHGGH